VLSNGTSSHRPRTAGGFMQITDVPARTFSRAGRPAAPPLINPSTTTRQPCTPISAAHVASTGRSWRPFPRPSTATGRRHLAVTCPLAARLAVTCPLCRRHHLPALPAPSPRHHLPALPRLAVTCPLPHFVERVAGAHGERALVSHGACPGSGEAGEAAAAAVGGAAGGGDKGRGGEKGRSPRCRRRRAAGDDDGVEGVALWATTTYGSTAAATARLRRWRRRHSSGSGKATATHSRARRLRGFAHV
jgi:hypothetical protein